MEKRHRLYAHRERFEKTISILIYCSTVFVIYYVSRSGFFWWSGGGIMLYIRKLNKDYWQKIKNNGLLKSVVKYLNFTLFNQMLDNWWISERSYIANLIVLIIWNLSQNSSHNFSRSCLWSGVNLFVYNFLNVGNSNRTCTNEKWSRS